MGSEGKRAKRHFKGEKITNNLVTTFKAVSNDTEFMK